MQHQISTQKIDFQIARSEDTLPSLELNELDLVLIDGRHAFPHHLLIGTMHRLN